MNPPYPWQSEAWQKLCHARRATRLGHALLLTGRPGIGKGAFAREFAQVVLCEDAGEGLAACGRCRSCQLFLAGNHPDLRSVLPLEDADSLGIDQVRELGAFFALKAHYGRAKIALLEPADRMTRAAANALLKLLEEPPSLGMFLLVAHQVDQLPATIRSRCQRVALDRIDPSQAQRWLAAQAAGQDAAAVRDALALAHHAPLAALAALQAGDSQVAVRVAELMRAVAQGRVHAVQAAQQTAEIPAVRLTDLMLGIAHRHWLEGHGFEVTPAGPCLNGLANPLHSRHVGEFAGAALDIKRQAQSSANFRQGDLADLLWQAWMQAARPARGGPRRSPAVA
ncbi:MAG: DNA polymerase III subunit delta' [Gammaproteobacteria bacterium]